MNNTAKTAAAVTVAVLATTAALTFGSRDRLKSLHASAQVPGQEQVASTTPVANVVADGLPPIRASEEPIVIPPLPANAVSVPDADLLKLSAMVNLPNADERRINKEQWALAVPIAKQLVQGPCDCEQRNWLNHYIELGNDALTGSDDAYYNLAVLMHKMARNDRQLADNPGRIVR